MRSTVIFSALVLMCGVVAAQNPPTINAQANTIYVSADGKYEATPDTAVVQFNIGAQEDLAKAAYARAAQEADQLRQILRSNGIDPKTAELGFYSFQPVRDYRNPKHNIVGYRVSTNVTLKLKDFSKAAPIVSSLGEQEWAENISLSYTLEDIDAAKLRAVDDAFQRARSEASALARAGGRTLGELTYASVDTYEQVRVLAAPMAGAQAMAAGRAEVAPPTAEFSPQKISVSARVSTMFALR